MLSCLLYLCEDQEPDDGFVGRCQGLGLWPISFCTSACSIFTHISDVRDRRGMELGQNNGRGLDSKKICNMHSLTLRKRDNWERMISSMGKKDVCMAVTRSEGSKWTSVIKGTNKPTSRCLMGIWRNLYCRRGGVVRTWEVATRGYSLSGQWA